MNFQDLFNFLDQLQKNNNKEWMDANRKWYRSLRHDFVLWLDDLDLTMAQLHEDYYPTPGKNGINRINNKEPRVPKGPIGPKRAKGPIGPMGPMLSKNEFQGKF